MKLILLTTGFLAMVASPAMAQELYFGAKTVKQNLCQGCQFDVTIPKVMTNDPALKPVAERLNSMWEKQLDKEKREASQRMKEALDDGLGSKPYYYKSFDVKSALNARIVSLEIQSDEYDGGAHGLPVNEGLVLDTHTGEIYKDLSVFLTDDHMTEFKKNLREDIKTSRLSDFDPQFGWNDWDKSTRRMSQIKDFYFDKNGLVVIFNPYTIAPYVSGIIEAHLYWYQLRDLGLKKTGPAALLRVR